MKSPYVWHYKNSERLLAKLGTKIEGGMAEVCYWSREKGSKGWTSCSMVPLPDLKPIPLEDNPDSVMNFMWTGELRRTMGMGRYTLNKILDNGLKSGLFVPRKDLGGNENVWNVADVIFYLENKSRERYNKNI